MSEQRVEELDQRLAEIRAEFHDAVKVAQAKFDERMQALANELGITLPRSPGQVQK